MQRKLWYVQPAGGGPQVEGFALYSRSNVNIKDRWLTIRKQIEYDEELSEIIAVRANAWPPV